MAGVNDLPTYQDVVRFILDGNCPDCFHAECLARVDVVEHLRRVLEAERAASRLETGGTGETDNEQQFLSNSAVAGEFGRAVMAERERQVRRAALAMYRMTNELSMSGARDLACAALDAALGDRRDEICDS
jgi:hypothetical protein